MADKPDQVIPDPPSKSRVLLPAENQVAEVLKPIVAPWVIRARPQRWTNEAKHRWVRSSVLVAAPFLQGSVKELRGVPPELLAAGVDLAIKGVVELVKELTD